ncbi:MAG: carbon starvation protein A [Candidatus Omnitrophota bacterium]
MGAIISLVVLSFLLAAYFFYGRFMNKVLGVDPNRETPAHKNKDGVDYVPAKNWFILFGHHFASIAGAAPIVGPVVAISLWGWGPAILWIVLGSIFFGGIHDLGALIVSVRNKGRSIADIAKDVISQRAKIVFSIFLVLTLILIIAVFVYVCANSFVSDPRIVTPSLGLIFIALIFGFLLYRLKLNQFLATILGLSLLAILILVGSKFPISFGENSLEIWMVVLLGYSFVASIIPVHVLLQPRDYLSCFLLFAGLILGYLGIFISTPDINIPVFVAWNSSAGWLWPMLLVTIACGAISGFHSLVAGGTTSKQLSTERHAPRIGYGAMLTEGALAVLALLVVAGGLTNLEELNTVLKNAGPIEAFGKGFGSVTKIILGSVGGLFAVTVLNAFVLTTLDTATRISRYIIEELTGTKNRFLPTLIVVTLSGWLAWGGRWKQIWPLFGASNQLLASFTLLIVSCWLLLKKRNFWVTIVPALFMLVTSVGALIYKFFIFYKDKEYLLLSICLSLLALAIYMLIDVIKIFNKHFKK